MSESFALRLGDLGLSRATEQTALLLALLSANGAKFNRQRGDRFALYSMLGYLSHAYCVGRVVHRDERFVQPAYEEIWRSFDTSRRNVDNSIADPVFGVAPTPRPDEPRRWDLDVVVGPVDGMRALASGMSGGTLAVLGGGGRRAFDPKHGPDSLADDYLVLVVRKRLGALLSDLAATLRQEGLLTHGAPPDCALKTSYAAADQSSVEGLCSRALELIAARIPKEQACTWSTAVNQPDFAYSSIREELFGNFKVCAFNGSSIAAGLSALLPQSHVSGFLGIVRRTHTYLLAVAACAAGGSLLAVPILKSDEKKSPVLDPHRPVLFESDLVGTDTGSSDAFLVATAITDTQLLPGVRLHDDGSATTTTICLRSKTQACRVISHIHQLHKKPFRLLNRDRSVWPDLCRVLKRFAGVGVDSRVSFSPSEDHYRRELD